MQNKIFYKKNVRKENFNKISEKNISTNKNVCKKKKGSLNKILRVKKNVPKQNFPGKKFTRKNVY